MEITNQCIRCGECIYYCPEEAIYLKVDAADINPQKCVECFMCIRSGICPVNAFKASKLKYPRSIRNAFSCVVVEHKETRVPGRGTEETKTNDVTGRFKVGELAFSIDVGRPGIGATFMDVEAITKRLAEIDVEFEEKNPVTCLMVDRKRGRLREEILHERVHSAIIEFKASVNRLDEVLKALDEASRDVESVFSVGVGCTLGDEGLDYLVRFLEGRGISYRPNGKLNVGLGRPLANTG
jgi:NAD-dependent dihydropyrimidine dehydrogenase PreA subunit